MKDFIWTLIVVWFIYKIVSLIRSSSKKQGSAIQHDSSHFDTSKTPNEQSIKNAVQRHLNKEGEYVDFEEIKK